MSKLPKRPTVALLAALLVLPVVAPAAIAQDDAAEDVTLTVWSWRTEDEDAYNEIFDVYEAANPGVTVEFVPFVNTDYNTILSTGLTGDGGPDVAQLRAYGGLQPLVEAGQLVPLDGTIDLSNFTDNALKAATGLSDGRVYGAPFAYQAFTAFYNKGIFDELGLTEPETWDEWISTLDTLAENDLIPISTPALDNWMIAIVTDAIGAPRYGGQAFEADILSGATDFNDPNYVAAMAIAVSLGLLFALLLQRARRGRSFLRTTYVLPFMISPLIVGYLWALILNPTFGPFNSVLKDLGLAEFARPWLGDPTTALPVVIMVNAWFWLGFPMLLFAAGLAAIPEDYAEAARVDGATPLQVFRHVTFPLLIPVFGTVAILTFIYSFNVFGLVWALGGVDGGPIGSTDVLGLLFYRTAFTGGVNAFGTASALAVLMFAAIFGVSMTARWWFRRLEGGLT